MKHKIPTITIGIPSYELGQSLVVTLQAIYDQLAGTSVKEILLISDGRKVPAEIRKQIKHPKLTIIESPRRQGQSQRINDICQMMKSDYLVLTNDDVIFDKAALKQLMVGLKRPVDLYTTSVRALPALSTFERVIQVSVQLTDTISRLTSNYQNYLSCNGRLIILSKSLASSLQIPKKLWNNDAYIYLFSQIHGFKHQHLPKVIAYHRLPDNISEYNRQGLKFRLSKIENQRYFSESLEKFYTLSSLTVLRALVQTFWTQPLNTVLYVTTQVVVKFWNMFIRSPYVIEQTFWQTDKSTKRIST